VLNKYPLVLAYWGLFALAVVLVVCHEAGLRLARRQLQASSSQVRPMEAALVIWMGMLLVLTLHHATVAFNDKNVLVHEEADSIAGVYRRLETLPPTHRAQMQSLLMAYLDAKLRKIHSASAQEQESSEQEAMGVHAQLYSLTGDLSTKHLLSEAQGLALEQVVNRMISLHFRSDYALRERMPALVLLVLAAQCCGIALLLGYANGSGSSRNSVLPVVYGLLVLSCSLLILDLDDARGGWLRVDTANWRDLSRIMHQLEATPGSPGPQRTTLPPRERPDSGR
jgi:hypothetical protein